jgi:MFS family permease
MNGKLYRITSQAPNLGALLESRDWALTKLRTRLRVVKLVANSTMAAHESPIKQLPRNVKLLALASLLNDIGSESIYPLMPKFLESLGGGKFALGMIEGVADTTASLLKVYSGSWSDRADRRKPFILLGYTVTSLARPILAFATWPWQVLLVRGADRFGKGIRSAPRDALLAESAPPAMHGRAFGLNRAMDHLGAAIGPALAMGFLTLWPGAIRTLFLLALIPGIGTIALIVWGLRESRATSPSPPPEQRSLRRILLPPLPASGPFRRYLLAIVLFTLGNSTDAFLLARASQLGVADAHLPGLWLVFHLVKSWGSWQFGRIVDRLGPQPALLCGWAIYALVYVGFGWADQTWHAWALFLLYAFYFALAEPAEKALVVRLTPSFAKGAAFGWFNLALGLGALPASALFGALYEDFGPHWAFGFGAACVALASAVLLTVRRHMPSTQAN